MRFQYISSTLVLLGSLLAFLFGAGLVFFQRSSPFGWQFWGSVAFAVLGFLCLLLTGGWLLVRDGMLVRQWWKSLAGSSILVIAALCMLLGTIALIDVRILFYQHIPHTLTITEWREEVQTLATMLETKHKNLFALVPREQFYDSVESLKARLPLMNEAQIIAGMMRLVAMPNDGHTEMSVFPAFPVHVYPLATTWIDNELYIVDTPLEYRNLIGSRILRIGNKSTNITFAEFTALIGAESIPNKRDRFCAGWGMTAELLYANGNTMSTKECTFELADSTGQTHSLLLRAEPFSSVFYWLYRPIANDASPLLSPHLRENKYSFEYLNNSKTLIFRLHEIVNAPRGETLTECFRRCEEFERTHDVQRIVVDVRSCTGGNNFLSKKLTDEILANPRINLRGKLFVLIGKRTFSAAVNLVGMLENRTKSIFVGEPTGEGPNMFGDGIWYTLPRTRLRVRISSRWHETAISEDKRNAVEPHIPVRYTFSDIFSDGKSRPDPALEAVVNYTPASVLTLPQQTNLSNAIPPQGRYCFSPYQLATIRYDSSASALHPSASLHISDWSGYRIFEVQTSLYALSDTLWATDIRNVMLYRVGDSLFLRWHGTVKALPLASKDFKLPMEFFAEGRIDEGLAHIRYNPAFVHERLEMQMTEWGYSFLRKNNLETAFKILKLCSEIFPRSSNAFDSLGEVFLQLGKKQEAITAYRQAITLDKDNENARKMLKELE